MAIRVKLLLLAVRSSRRECKILVAQFRVNLEVIEAEAEAEAKAEARCAHYSKFLMG
jgi:hypothetical protein